MRSLRHVGLALFAVLVVIPSVSSAQRTGARARSAAAGQGGFWELGVDGGVSIGMDTPKSFSIDIPVSMVRAGYYVSDILSLEPGLSFRSFAAKGTTGQSAWTLELGALYHLDADRTKQQLFIHPLLAFTGGSGGANTITSLGIGAGMKKPLFEKRLAGRLEANIVHSLKSGFVPATTSINGLFGISIYTQ